MRSASSRSVSSNQRTASCGASARSARSPAARAYRKASALAGSASIQWNASSETRSPGSSPKRDVEDLGDAQVGTPPPRRAQLLVQRVLDQRVREGELVTAAGDGAHERRGVRRLERDEHRLLVGSRHVGEQPEPEVASHHRRELQDALDVGAEPGDAVLHDLAHRRRQPDRADVTHDHPAPVLAPDRARLREIAQALGHEERVPVGLAHERVAQFQAAGAELVPGAALEQGQQRVSVEARQRDALDAGLAVERHQDVGEHVLVRHVGVAVGHDDERAHRCLGADDVLEEEERRLVGPVQVVEDEHHGRELGCARQEVHDRVVQEVTLGVRL